MHDLITSTSPPSSADGHLHHRHPALREPALNWLVLVEGGATQCFAPAEATGARCAARGFTSDARNIDLMGGVLAPGLTTFGSDLGLSEIKLDPSMTDGRVFDPLTMAVPGILGDIIVRAVDGLQFAGRM
ncbi:hypothetical protein FB451DRAFT_1409451 [Mycena latifolia]|nr:hypothetical protein FB451DRAFT_1409451 [Mycena latifolia]